MMELIKAFGWMAFGLMCGVALIVFLWFAIGMAICFYKIYFKKQVQK